MLAPAAGTATAGAHRTHLGAGECVGTARFFFLLGLSMPSLFSSARDARWWVERTRLDALALPFLFEHCRGLDRQGLPPVANSATPGGGTGTGGMRIRAPEREMQSTLFKAAYQGARGPALRDTLAAFARAWRMFAPTLHYTAPAIATRAPHA